MYPLVFDVFLPALSVRFISGVHLFLFEIGSQDLEEPFILDGYEVPLLYSYFQNLKIWKNVLTLLGVITVCHALHYRRKSYVNFQSP